MAVRWFAVLVDTGVVQYPICVSAPDIGRALQVAQAHFPRGLRFDARLASYLNGMDKGICEWGCDICEEPCNANCDFPFPEVD